MAHPTIMSQNEEGQCFPKDPINYTAKERNLVKADDLAKDLLIFSIPNDILMTIDSCETAKDLWDEIEKQMQGPKLGARTKLAIAITSYENFVAKERELLVDTYTRLCSLLNELKRNNLTETKL